MPEVVTHILRVCQDGRTIHENRECSYMLSRLVAEAHHRWTCDSRFQPRFVVPIKIIVVSGAKSLVHGLDCINAIPCVASLKSPWLRIGRAPVELGRVEPVAEVADGVGGLEDGAGIAVRDGDGANGRRLREGDGGGIESGGRGWHGAVERVADGKTGLAGRERDGD